MPTRVPRIAPSEITPSEVYFSRRALLTGALAAGASSLLRAAEAPPAQGAALSYTRNAPGAGAAIYQHSAVREREMLEVTRGIAVGHHFEPRMLAAQCRQHACFFRTAPVRRRKVAREPLTVPCDSRTNRLCKAERTADRRDVQIGTRREQHETIAAATMGLERRERIGVHPAGEQAWHKLVGPRLDRLPGTAPEHCADGGGFHFSTVRPPEGKTRERRQHRPQARETLRVLAEHTGEIWEQRVAAREGAVEIEQRQRRCCGRCSGRRERSRVPFGQAALPAAASWRSTYCRIPPWR